MKANNKQGHEYFDRYFWDKHCRNQYTANCALGRTKNNICQLISYIPEYSTDMLICNVQEYLCQKINAWEILRSLPTEFSRTLAMHMKQRKYKVKQLSDASLVNERTIQRLLANEAHNTSLNTIIAICIGLNLSPIFSFDLISKSGCGFKRTAEHNAYKVILIAHYHSDIYKCNEILESMNIPLLGNKEFL